MSQTRKGIGCIGTLLIGIGLLIVINQFWNYSWGWAQIGAGSILAVMSIRFGEKSIVILPAMVLLLTGLATLLWEYHFISFQSWRIIPILLGAFGIGFFGLWVMNWSGRWLLIVGGLLCIVSGSGLSFRSWWQFRKLLNSMLDWWVVMVLFFVVALAVDYWRKQSEKT